MFEAAQDAADATEFMETIKVEFYSDHVFIFTPKGDVKRFPKGATTLDFAYAVHTDVGHRCTGAKVNGRMVPLRYELQSGDTVEIMTSPNQKPSRDWLDIARTGRAIQKIRRYVREEERELGIRIGREMLESELKRTGWTLAKFKADSNVDEFIAKRGLADIDALYVEIARGQLGSGTVVKKCLPEEEAKPSGSLASLLNRFRSRAESPVLISGEDGVLVSYAKCCNPLPGEAVTGFITRGRGITVHRVTCKQLKGMDADRRIPVEWDAGADARHSGEVQIVCSDQPGLLANISRVCEQAAVNINRAEARAIGDNRAICTLELAVRDVSELTRLMKNLERVKGVESVERVAASPR